MDNYPHERMGIQVISVTAKAGTLLPSCYIKLSHGSVKSKTDVEFGDYLRFNHMCSFEVQALQLEVSLKQTTSGRLHRRKEIGKAVIQLADVETVECCDALCGLRAPPAPLELKLWNHKGVECDQVEKVTIRIVKVTPPKEGENVNILSATWNCGNTPPPSASELSHWLPEEKIQQAALIVIGAQECAYEKRNIDGVEYSSTEQDWVDTLSMAIGSAHTVYRAHSFGKMRLCVWARVDVIAGITHYQHGEKGTGLGHFYSNKGGIAAALSLWDTTFVFVNSHLAAHQGQTFVLRRNQDYRDIATWIDLGYPNCGLLSQFHHCVWVGDLNYRLDLSERFGEEAWEQVAHKKCFEHVTARVEAGQYEELLRTDQLTQAIAAGTAFVGFEEGTITHPPTFKVKTEPGFDFKRRRLPAYCDRVLWKSLLPSLRAHSESLWCGGQLATSDHKPVATLIRFSLRPPRPEWWPRISGGAHSGDQRKHHRKKTPHATSSGASERVRSADGPGPKIHRFSALVGERRNGVGRDSFARSFGLFQRTTSSATSALTFKNLLRLPTWHLDILSLRAEGLPYGSYATRTSNPYIVFYCDAMAQPARSQVVSGTLDPLFPSQDLCLKLVAAQYDDLKWEYILVSVMHRRGGEFLADWPLGVGVIRVEALLADIGGESEIEVDLLCMGVMKGKVHVKLKMHTGISTPLKDFQRQRLKTLSRSTQGWKLHCRCHCSCCACFSPPHHNPDFSAPRPPAPRQLEGVKEAKRRPSEASAASPNSSASGYESGEFSMSHNADSRVPLIEELNMLESRGARKACAGEEVELGLAGGLGREEEEGKEEEKEEEEEEGKEEEEEEEGKEEGKGRGKGLETWRSATSGQHWIPENDVEGGKWHVAPPGESAAQGYAGLPYKVQIPWGVAAAPHTSAAVGALGVARTSGLEQLARSAAARSAQENAIAISTNELLGVLGPDIDLVFA